MNKSKRNRPPLKWAGGKYQILDRIAEQLPKGDRLIEPFVGSGTVFLNSDYKRFVLNDINADLINFYKILKREGEDFICFAKKYFNTKNNTEESYYRLRDEFNKTEDITYKSALFLYINKHGYNGLIRYNASGGFNVPFGRRKKSHFPEKEMHYFLQKAKRASFSCKDFEHPMKKAKQGDVIYCDPPYVPLSSTANFTAYSTEGFGPDEQRRLALLAKELSNKGIAVIISNHCTDFTRSIYKDAKKYTFPVRRFISCNGAKREHAMEILAVYSPKK